MTEPTHIKIDKDGDKITIATMTIAEGVTIAPSVNTSILATTYVTTIAKYVTHLLETLSPEEVRAALQQPPIELVKGLAEYTGAAIADE